MTREQVYLFITKTPTYYQDLPRDLWFRSMDLRPLEQPAVKMYLNINIKVLSLIYFIRGFKQ
jgi:hypothetical protein